MSYEKISQNVRVTDPDFAQDSERTVCSGTAGRDAHFIDCHRHTGERGGRHKCSFFGAFLPQERQASESASGLAFVHSCKSRRRLHVSETHAPDPTPSTW